MMSKVSDKIKDKRGGCVFGVLLMLFFAFFFYKLVFVYPTEVSLNKRLYDSLNAQFNYSFAGIVTHYEEHIVARGEHIGVATVALTYSDVDAFDPSDSSDFYICLIRKSEARVMFSIQYELERKRKAKKHESITVGDSLVFDGLNDRFVLFYGRDSASWSPTWISSDSEEHRRMASYLHEDNF
jgi:hypothetical protein